tara:strand:- start:1422 stop:3833 length:2412 start_codon:yes stop_codon:yes gene_type:complete
MGTYFQQLKFENAIGHEGLQVLYKQAVRYDYSGMMRTKLQEAFKSAEKNHGFNSTNFTWFNANPHWLDKNTGRPTQQAPHWEEGWISDSNWKGQEYFGKKTEYKKNSGVVGGSNQLTIGDIIWNGEDPNLLETWGAQSINYRRWYRVIDRNNEEPIILRLRRLNSDLSVWHSPDGAVDEFDLNEEAALFNYKIYNVPDAPQAGGGKKPTKELVLKRLEIIVKKLPQIKNKKFWMEILKKVSAKKGGMVGEEEEDEGYKTDDTEEAEPGTAPQLPLAGPPEELIAAHQQTLQHQEDLIPQGIINALQDAWNSFRFEADPEYNPEPLPPDATYADLWDHIMGSVFLLVWTLMNETINEQPHLRDNYRNYVVEFIILFMMLVLWGAYDRIIFNDTSDRTSQVRRYINLMWLRWTPRVMRALLNFMLHPLEAAERFRELVAAMMINDFLRGAMFMGGAPPIDWEVPEFTSLEELKDMLEKYESNRLVYNITTNPDVNIREDFYVRQNRMSGIRLRDGSLLPWSKIKEGRIKIKGTMNFGHGTPPVDDEHWWRYRERRPDEQYTGGGAIQSYFAGSEPQRDYTWNVAQFNGDYDDFGAAQHILELSMRYDDFGDEDEADHRREQKQRYIIDAYHHPNRRVWETLLRWMRSRPIGVEQQVQQQQQPPPPPPGGQVAMPAAGGGKRNKTQKRKRRKKKTRGRKKRKGSRKKRKRRKKRTRRKRGGDKYEEIKAGIENGSLRPVGDKYPGWYFDVQQLINTPSTTYYQVKRTTGEVINDGTDVHPKEQGVNRMMKSMKRKIGRLTKNKEKL